MSRNILRVGVAAAAVIVAAAVSTVPAQADTTTPASGSLVISESTTFAKAAAKSGIVASAPGATVSGTAKTGFSAAFPVTGGTGDIPNFFGNISLGGTLRLCDSKTKRTVTFKNLAFSIDSYAITGVAAGTSTPVTLLDVAGEPIASPVGILPQTLVSDLAVDADGAKVVNSALKTKFFVEGQTVGGLSISFTPEVTTAS